MSNIRLVVTSDTHRKVDPTTIPDGDVFLHVGDLMTTGYPHEFLEQVEWLAALPHKIKLFVPGNHDFHFMVYPGPALQDMRRAGVIVLGLPGNIDFETFTLPNGMKVLGLPYVESLPRWAYSLENPEFNEHMKRTLHTNMNVDIIASHSPPHGVLDTMMNGKHRGVKEYSNHFDFVHRFQDNGNFGWATIKQPKYWFCGHVHEAYGEVDLIGTKFYNVAMSDRFGNHANPPVVLDI